MSSFFPGGQDTWVAKVDLVDTILAAHPNDLQNAVASLEIGGVSIQNIAYAASITPNVPAGQYVIVGTLTGNITINAPTNALTGRQLTFRFTQDGTGGRTVTWNAVFSVTNWTVNTAANAKTEATFTYDGSSWVLAAGVITDKGGVVFNAQAYGAADLVDSTAAIDLAVQAAWAAGGGTVWLPPVTNGYILTRLLGGGFAQKGGGIRLRKGVSLLGSKTKLLLRGNCDFITHRNSNNYNPTLATITADVAYGDVTVQVDSSASPFAVGSDVYIRGGNSLIGETAESRWFSFAKVLTIADGTHITLDRPILNAFTVAATAANNRTITLLDDLLEGISIGGFELINQTASGGNAESGINLMMARNIRIFDLIGDDVGPGLVGTQYCENIKGDNLEVRQCQKQGAAAKGRCFNFSETSDVEFTNVRGEKFENCFAFAEFFCRNIRFKNVRVTNNFAGRVQTTALFPTQASDMSFDGLLVEGNGSVWQDDGGVSATYPGQDQDPMLRFKDVTIRVVDSNTVTPMVSWFDGWLRLRGGFHANLLGDYYDVKRYTKTFKIIPNQSFTGFTLIQGIYRRVRIFVNSTTGITTMALIANSAGSAELKNALVAGQLVDMNSTASTWIESSGGGAGWNSRGLAKQIYYSSDGTVPADSYCVVEVEAYTPGGTTGISPFPDDGSQGYVQDTSLYSRTNRLSVTGDFLRSRQTPTEAVLVSGVDATAGELIGVTLTAARVVGAPLNPVTGQRLTFTLIQGGVGAFAVTWNAIFKKTWSDAGNATNARSTISFVYDGTNWNQDSAQAPYV